MTSRPKAIVLVGSPRRQGNTAYAAGVAAEELERNGVACKMVMLADIPLRLADSSAADEAEREARAQVEALIDEVWSSDGVILATPIHFANVSALLKAFMDATNDRYLAGDWLSPRAIGLLAIGGQGGYKATVDAMRRYLNLVAPGQPTVVVATGQADAEGEAAASADVSRTARTMAAEVAAILRRE